MYVRCYWRVSFGLIRRLSRVSIVVFSMPLHFMNVYLYPLMLYYNVIIQAKYTTFYIPTHLFSRQSEYINYLHTKISLQFGDNCYLKCNDMDV